eukprot:g73673.t1
MPPHETLQVSIPISSSSSSSSCFFSSSSSSSPSPSHSSSSSSSKAAATSTSSTSHSSPSRPSHFSTLSQRQSEINKERSELCRRWLDLSKQLSYLPPGSWRESEDSNEVFTLHHFGDTGIEVVYQKEEWSNEQTTQENVLGDLQTELQARRTDAQALGTDIEKLLYQIGEEGGVEADAMGGEVAGLAVVKGNHLRRVRELLSLQEMDIKATVRRTRINKVFALAETLLAAARGKRGGGTPLASVERWHPQAGRWELLDCKLANGRSECSTGILNGSVFVLGGSADSDMQSVEEFDPVHNVWKRVAPMFRKRRQCAVATSSLGLYALGGWDGAVHMASVERYDPDTRKWSDLPPMGFKRSGCAAAFFMQRLWVLGGINENYGFLNSVECFDEKSQEWEYARMLNSKRSGLTCAVLGSSLYAIGGLYGNTRLSSVERFDADGDCWELITPMHFPRYFAAAAVHEGLLYVSGGGGSDGVIHSSVEVYDLATERWTLLDNAELGSARWGHAMGASPNSYIRSRDRPRGSTFRAWSATALGTPGLGA